MSPAVYGWRWSTRDPTAPVVALLVAYFLWGAASHAFGAVQDIGADREAGIGSVATVIGARATVRLAVALYLLAGILLLAGGALGGGSEPLALAALLVAAVRCSTRCRGGAWTTKTPPPRIADGGVSCG